MNAANILSLHIDWLAAQKEKLEYTYALTNIYEETKGKSNAQVKELNKKAKEAIKKHNPAYYSGYFSEKL